MKIRLYEKNNDPRRLAEVVRVLNDGGVIVYPTGTTYALGCHALKERAVERICRIKNIDPKEHPLAMVC
ncbi:MAG: Sua5/YciO/YrdC/YwlC family protein, partial [Bacteroidaceae bacterium]|nr:Sua5/YciO/YrdC/YwlC family protein [Bacteroidaceae bacterium]